MADGEEAALRALPVDLDGLADLLEGGDDVRFGLVDLQTGEVHPYSEMLGEYLGLGEGFDPGRGPGSLAGGASGRVTGGLPGHGGLHRAGE